MPWQVYGTICVIVCCEMDGVVTPEVWQNLNSQGVCRVVSFLRVMENLGIVEDNKLASPQAKRVRLGAAGTPKAIAPESRWKGLRKFVEGARRAHSLPAPVNLESVRENDKRADDLLKDIGQPLLGPDSQYVRPTIR